MQPILNLFKAMGIVILIAASFYLMWVTVAVGAVFLLYQLMKLLDEEDTEADKSTPADEFY